MIMFGCTPLRFALALSKVLHVRHDVETIKLATDSYSENKSYLMFLRHRQLLSIATYQSWHVHHC